MSEPVTVCLALPTLFDSVVARFDSDGTLATHHFGWREPQRHKSETNRLVWVPGDPNSAVGSILGPMQPGRNPRPLATLGELFTVYLSSVDPQFHESERAQYQATRLLYDAWYRAVYLAARGTFAVLSQSWNTSKNERRHGAEIVCVCSIQSMIPDSPYTTVTATDADIVTSLDDVDEVTSIP